MTKRCITIRSTGDRRSPPRPARLKAALASLVALMAAAGSFAAPSEAEALAFDRAALADPAAVDALRGRIADAAERVCRREYDGAAVLGPRARRRAIEACVVVTVADAEQRTGLRPGPALLAARR